MARSLVIGASGGIGGAFARALSAREDVTALSRSADGLDVTDEASVARVIGALTGAYDTVIVATGALVIDGTGPEKTLKSLDPAVMARQFAVNAIGPMLVLKHVLPLIPRDAPARFAALSARVGSIGDNSLGGWYSYRTAKAGLNQMLRTASVELARSHKQLVIAALHPGTVDTPFTAAYSPPYAKLTPDAAVAGMLGTLDAMTPADTGAFRDWEGKTIPW
jgi:NAD(P)-dependent dehydrogenase (short-subunit alcohol dehydrogenase family)